MTAVMSSSDPAGSLQTNNPHVFGIYILTMHHKNS